MTFEEIKNKIINRFGEEIILSEQTTYLQPQLIVDKNKLEELCLFLRDDSDLYFDYLQCLSGVDYAADQQELAVVYHLNSIPYKHSIVLKVMLPFDRTSAESPSCPSVCNVWRTADWHEREAFDLYGIMFTNHPDLRRILCPDDWEGFPLRKDYKEAEMYKGLKITFEKNND